MSQAEEEHVEKLRDTFRETPTNVEHIKLSL